MRWDDTPFAAVGLACVGLTAIVFARDPVAALGYMVLGGLLGFLALILADDGED